MKTSILILASLLGASLLAGCAATPTRESTGEYIDNSAITAKVKTALADDEIVKARDVQVETFRGTVQLSGFVDTKEQKKRATTVARSVQGVRDVENNLIVK
ncbi:MAG: BON domain-containing protein [Burkholderiales bacterium]|nr:BON domain-containing protein [Opitutaceae bacterium]